VQGFESLLADLVRDYPWLEAVQCRRLARAYGTRARRVLGMAKDKAALGRDFGAGLSEAEVLYLMGEEWAEEAADVVWRRSKLGLRLSVSEIKALDDFMAERRAGRTAANAVHE
jgi:glycerol-3-phosphate dehydrogenase